jgi:uncharacterized protein YbbK (DUF523 family)
VVSACLLGVRCRYDGRSKKSSGLVRSLRGRRVVPVCPEQLGGLPTPRAPSRIVAGTGEGVLDGISRVVNAVEADVTGNFLKGAEETLKLCRVFGVGEAVLKTRSPSCGRCGVTHALLRRSGLKVRTVAGGK